MAVAVTAAGAGEDLITGRVVVMAGKARAAVGRGVKAGLALADTRCVVAQTVATACVVRARDQRVARRVPVPAGHARTAVCGKIEASVARCTDSGLVVAGTVAIAVAATGARLELIARWVAIPASLACATVSRKIVTRVT